MVGATGRHWIKERNHVKKKIRMKEKRFEMWSNLVPPEQTGWFSDQSSKREGARGFDW